MRRTRDAVGATGLKNIASSSVQSFGGGGGHVFETGPHFADNPKAFSHLRILRRFGKFPRLTVFEIASTVLKRVGAQKAVNHGTATLLGSLLKEPKPGFDKDFS